MGQDNQMETGFKPACVRVSFLDPIMPRVSHLIHGFCEFLGSLHHCLNKYIFKQQTEKNLGVTKLHK